MGGDLPTAIREEEARHHRRRADGNPDRLDPGDPLRRLFRGAAVRAGGRGAGHAGARSAPRLCPGRAPLRARRGLCAAKNEIGFDREMKELARVRASSALKPMIEQGVPANDLLGIAEHVAMGEYASIEAAISRRRIISARRRRSRTRSPTWSRPSGITRCSSRWAGSISSRPLRRGAAGLHSCAGQISRQRLGALWTRGFRQAGRRARAAAACAALNQRLDG